MCMVLIIIATTSKERGHITLYTWNVLSFHFFFLKSSKIRFMLRLGLPWYKCGCHTHTGHNVIHTHKHRWLQIYPWPFSMFNRTWGYFICLLWCLRQTHVTYFNHCSRQYGLHCNNNKINAGDWFWTNSAYPTTHAISFRETTIILISFGYPMC